MCLICDLVVSKAHHPKHRADVMKHDKGRNQGDRQCLVVNTKEERLLKQIGFKSPFET